MKTLPLNLNGRKAASASPRDQNSKNFNMPRQATQPLRRITLLDEPSHAIVLIGRGYDQERCQAELLRCLESYESTGGLGSGAGH